jgi:hypothetical protein
VAVSASASAVALDILRAEGEEAYILGELVTGEFGVELV